MAIATLYIYRAHFLLINDWMEEHIYGEFYT